MVPSLVTAVVASVVVAPWRGVQGYAKFVQLVPNGANVPNTPNVGHLDPAGQSGLSAFGKAFSKASNAWTSTLCHEDSDSDGYTNGQELGDPCCTWTESNPATLIADGLSNPSDASKIPTNPKLVASCTASASANGTASGKVPGGVGTVAPAEPSGTRGVPRDDDEDDSSESAVQTAGVASFSLHCIVVGLAVTAAIATMAW